MSFTIRATLPSDYRETEVVAREAFWNQHVPGCDEHYFLHILRTSPAYLPDLDTMALLGSVIIGNVVYSNAVIKCDGGGELQVLCLGLLAVLPQFQRKGAGRQLFEFTKLLARHRGHHAVFLYGDPDYYSRLGFVPAEFFGVKTQDNMFAAALQCYELRENALTGIQGCFVEDKVFEIEEAAAREFDRSFPAKNMLAGTPSQARYLQVLEMRRKA